MKNSVLQNIQKATGRSSLVTQYFRKLDRLMKRHIRIRASGPTVASVIVSVIFSSLRCYDSGTEVFSRVRTEKERITVSLRVQAWECAMGKIRCRRGDGFFFLIYHSQDTQGIHPIEFREEQAELLWVTSLMIGTQDGSYSSFFLARGYQKPPSAQFYGFIPNRPCQCMPVDSHHKRGPSLYILLPSRCDVPKNTPLNISSCQRLLAKLHLSN